MRKTALITVVIPTFNSAKTLNKALLSALTQKYSNVEVWVIDAESTDGTLEIVKNVSKQDKRVHWLSEPDAGVYDAMNKGIQRATGDWLYFLGSDDFLWADDVFENVFSPNNLDSDVIYGAYEIGGVVKQKSINIRSVLLSEFCHQSIFYRRSIFDEIGPYEIKYKVNADIHLNLKLISNRNIRWKEVDTIVCSYACGGVSARFIDKKFAYDVVKECEKYLKNTIERREILIYLKRYAFYHIKYFNFFIGVKYMIESGLFLSHFRDICYCLKIRWGFASEGVKIL